MCAVQRWGRPSSIVPHLISPALLSTLPLFVPILFGLFHLLEDLLFLENFLPVKELLDLKPLVKLSRLFLVLSCSDVASHVAVCVTNVVLQLILLWQAMHVD